MSTRYRLRPATQADIPALQEIERSASILFANSPYPELSAGGVIASDIYQTHLTAGHLIFMAFDHAGDKLSKPLGFAFTAPLGDGLHLHELSTHADHQRQGVGSVLIHAVLKHAKLQNSACVSLTTYRTIEWNGPFYRKHGFVEPNRTALSPDLASILSKEIAKGANAQDRCAMVHIF